MIELLILYILSKKNLNLYQISQTIKNQFGYLFTGSFGSIHPVLKKLLNEGYISTKKTISKGGKTCSTYKITPRGKIYFEEEIQNTEKNTKKTIEVKLACIDICKGSTKNNVIEDAEIFYKNQIIMLNNLLKTNIQNIIQQKQIENLINYYETRINSLKYN